MAAPASFGPTDGISKPADPTLDVIPVLPEDATAEQKDLHWFKHVYQGDKMPQLTWRAVIMGGFLGMVMSAANLYTTLSIGWAFGIAITACVLSFVMWNLVILTSGKRVSQMSVLENACMASTASAAGYSTGSTIATMFGALVLLHEPAGVATIDIKTWEVPGVTPGIVIIFTLATGLMGVFLAIPMKRQMINHEQLPFPSGIAAAETLKSLYSQSADAIKKAYVLVVGLAAGLLIGLLRADDDALGKITWLKKAFDATGNMLRIPADLPMRFLNSRYPEVTDRFGKVVNAQPAGFAFEPSALLIAAGMIVGLRTSLSLILGSLILYVGVGPYLAHQEALVIQQPAIRASQERMAQAKLEPVAAMFAIRADIAEVETARLAAENREAGIAAPTTEAITTAAAVAFSKLTADEFAERAESREFALGKAAAKEAAVAAADAVNFKPSLRFDWGTGGITLTRWSLWGGTATMVFASLMSVALQWKTLLRAFTGSKAEASVHESAAMAKIEVPGMWMIMGMVPITIAMVWLQIQAFSVSWYAGIIAVAMSFVLSLVASRATGETDTTPIGAMGKVMQLTFAGLAPANISANLASAGIAANSASSSADLLTDLKTGYLLGANPRKQFLAQFFGVFFGTIAIVPIFYLMVPTKAKLETFALPSTRAWEAVARVLVKGIGELPPSAITAIYIGAAVGMTLPILDRLLPAKYRVYLPSATGLGLSWVIPFQNAFSFLVGAVITTVWTKLHKKTAQSYNVPVASGLVAGESLMAAALAITATVIGLLS